MVLVVPVCDCLQQQLCLCNFCLVLECLVVPHKPISINRGLIQFQKHSKSILNIMLQLLMKFLIFDCISSQIFANLEFVLNIIALALILSFVLFLHLIILQHFIILYLLLLFILINKIVLYILLIHSVYYCKFFFFF